MINARDSKLLTSRLREVGEIKQKIVSLHQNLGLLQQSLEKSEIRNVRVMKYLEAQIRDASFKFEERIETELSTIYLAKDSLHITASLLRLQEIFKEAEKQTDDYHRNKLIRLANAASSQNQRLTDVSLLGRIQQRGLQLVKGSSQDDLDLFTMIPNLKTLGVDCDHYGNAIDCFYNFVHLEHLEKLSIRRWMKFDLDMCSIPWAISLPNLKKLSFLECNLQGHELSAISMLPNLEVLKLIDACRGSKWETSDGGFHRLKRLVIKKAGLKYWNVVGDHFPMLESLEISECYRLKKIPSDFADITTLALIQLSRCRDSLLASAKRIQREQNKYGNDALLKRWASQKVQQPEFLIAFAAQILIPALISASAMTLLKNTR
nr:probable disease resistance protein RF9 [Ipomoea trifida]